MVLDQMNMELGGGYNPQRKAAKGYIKNRSRSLRLLSYIRKNRKNRNTKKANKQLKKGGSVLADVSVPASLLLLNQFFKNKKTQDNSSKKFRKTKKNKKTRK